MCQFLLPMFSSAVNIQWVSDALIIYGIGTIIAIGVLIWVAKKRR